MPSVRFLCPEGLIYLILLLSHQLLGFFFYIVLGGMTQILYLVLSTIIWYYISRYLTCIFLFITAQLINITNIAY